MQHELLKFARNTKGRDFFVGDMHGCYRLFRERLKEVGFNPDRDRVFSVGDLVDRGPDPYLCLQLVFEPWFYAVRGNHEQMMAGALLGEDPPMPWWLEGGTWSLDEDQSSLLQTVQDALERMPLAMEVEASQGTIGVIHADVTSNCWGNFHQDKDTWSRKRLDSATVRSVRGIDVVVAGHTIQDKPRLVGNVLHIDTGAFMTGDLQLLEASTIFRLALGPTLKNSPQAKNWRQV